MCNEHLLLLVGIVIHLLHIFCISLKLSLLHLFIFKKLINLFLMKIQLLKLILSKVNDTCVWMSAEL